jgi:membrane associated rhomboid family serine protease
VPLSDRDYMRNPPPERRPRRFTGISGASALNPVLVLIAINFVFYIATLVAAKGTYPFGDYHYITSDRITYYLGLIPYYFTNRPWTILTAMFIHAGFWHLFGNMITLYFFGMFLVRLVGNNWFLLLYLVGGVIGNALYAWLGQPLSLAIGASGAVYAVAGALVVMVPRLPVRLYFIIPVPLWVVVLIFFVIWSIPGVASSTIAWQAHLGGLATGLVFGWFFRRRIRLNFYRY